MHARKQDRKVHSTLENKLKSKLHVERKVGRHIKASKVQFATHFARMYVTVTQYSGVVLRRAIHTYVHVRRPGCFVTGKLLINFRKAQTHAYVHARVSSTFIKGGKLEVGVGVTTCV